MEAIKAGGRNTNAALREYLDDRCLLCEPEL